MECLKRFRLAQQYEFQGTARRRVCCKRFFSTLPEIWLLIAGRKIFPVTYFSAWTGSCQYCACAKAMPGSVLKYHTTEGLPKCWASPARASPGRADCRHQGREESELSRKPPWARYSVAALGDLSVIAIREGPNQPIGGEPVMVR